MAASSDQAKCSKIPAFHISFFPLFLVRKNSRRRGCVLVILFYMFVQRQWDGCGRLKKIE